MSNGEIRDAERMEIGWKTMRLGRTAEVCIRDLEKASGMMKRDILTIALLRYRLNNWDEAIEVGNRAGVR
jgi:hypothetical protein